MKFIRRKCDVERYERAKEICKKISDKFLVSSMQQVIDEFDMQSALIDYFTSKVSSLPSTTDSEEVRLPIKLIVEGEDRLYQIVDAELQCRLVGDNYVEEWRNIGAEYHNLRVNMRRYDFHYDFATTKPFLLYQLQNQERLEQICKEMNILVKAYFGGLPFEGLGNKYPFS